jgi:hypothetical protein
MIAVKVKRKLSISILVVLSLCLNIWICVVYAEESPVEDFYIVNIGGTGFLRGYNGVDTDIVIPAYYQECPIVYIDDTYGYKPFANKNLNLVVFPITLESIGAYSFLNNNLMSINVIEGVTRIGHNAFENNKLTEVVLPRSLINIGADVFLNNPNLTTITVYKDSYAEQWAMDNGYSVEYIREPSKILVDGSVEPTVINITIPYTLSFTINPNNIEGDTILSSALVLTNNTYAPVKVGIDVFTELPTSSHQFEDIHTSRYTDEEWNNLNSFFSETYIALGLQPVDVLEWQTTVNTIWARTIQDIGYQGMGVLKPNSSAKIKVVGKHGRMFSEELNVEYTVRFILELN